MTEQQLNDEIKKAGSPVLLLTKQLADKQREIVTIHDYAFLRNRIARAIARERQVWQRHG